MRTDLYEIDERDQLLPLGIPPPDAVDPPLNGVPTAAAP